MLAGGVLGFMMRKWSLISALLAPRMDARANIAPCGVFVCPSGTDVRERQLHHARGTESSRPIFDTQAQTLHHVAP